MTRRSQLRTLAWLLWSWLLTMPAMANGAEALRLEIRGTINPATAHFLSRAVQQAETQKAHLLLVELDTPGGLVSSVREMTQTIDQSKVPVVVYTAPAGASATSAGALLMISSHVAVMAPGTNIGAAHPVGAQGEDIEGAMAEKAVQDISAFARSMAELRDRNAKAASEVVSKSKSYSAEEALKENLIDIVAADQNALWVKIHNREISIGKEKISLKTEPPPPIQSIEMTLGEKILNYLSHPNIAAILMTLGILLIYAELNAPGVGLPGILGGLCLITAFIAFQAIPIRTGGIVLLILGVLLMLSEVVVSSGGILAFGGALSLLFGFLWVVDPQATDLTLSPWILVTVAGVLFSGTALIVYGTTRIRKLSREALVAAGGGDLAGIQGYKGRIQSAASDGRSGKVLIRGEIWDFTSDEVLRENDEVYAQITDGLRLKASKIKE